MTNESRQAAITRWGDPLFSIAVVLLNERAAAERATAAAFVKSLATPARDLEAALYSNLIKQRSHRRLAFRGLLPRTLARLTPLDRALLGLWLLRSCDGSRLMAISGLAADDLLTHLATALAHLAVADDPLHTDPAQRAMFTAWLRAELGLASTDQPSVDRTHATQWRALVADARTLLHNVVDRQHLPVGCAETITETLAAQQDTDARRWWQRPAISVGGVIVLALAALLLLIAPWNRTIPASTAAPIVEPPNARQIVTDALDAWTTMPVSGTLHRRVWALDRRYPLEAPAITDVWFAAGSAQHRVEVRRNDKLVEWQIADGRQRFEYAADGRYSACEWNEPDVLDRLARGYDLAPGGQAAVRDARIVRGAYGAGYDLLKQALDTPNLRSFGTRSNGQTALLMLSFTDTRTKPARKLLLWIDPRTRELQAIQELATGGAQTVARDLWRLLARDAPISGVPLIRPDWFNSNSTLQRARLVDPACPALDADRIVSLRMLAGGGGWWGNMPWLPTTPPTGITQAAILSTSTVQPDPNTLPSDLRLLLIGQGRRLRMTTAQGPNTAPVDAPRRGPWAIRLNEDAGVLYGSACRYDSVTRACLPLLTIRAEGWTRDDLLRFIDTLQPVSARSWVALRAIFLDPAPLAPDAQAALTDALNAVEPRPGSGLYNAVEVYTRIAPQRPVPADPYSVPLTLQQPERTREEQWIVYSDTQILRSRREQRLPDGTLLAADTSDGTRSTTYSALSGEVQVGSTETWMGPMLWINTSPAMGRDLLLSFFKTTAPITLTSNADAITLEQSADYLVPQQNVSVGFNRTPWLGDLPAGRFWQRLWLDPRSRLPMRLQFFHRSAEGRETLLRETTLTAWRYDSAPSTDFFTLPPLPTDTITLDQPPMGVARVTSTLDLSSPQRVLLWSDNPNLTIQFDIDPATVNAGLPENELLAQALYNPIQQLDYIGVIRVTRYKTTNGTILTVRQGSRNLLRHVLRYHGWDSAQGGVPATGVSVAVPVVIAGQPRTAWLLTEGASSALVVEVDNVLLHFSGLDAAYLTGPLLAELPKLTWVQQG